MRNTGPSATSGRRKALAAVRDGFRCRLPDPRRGGLRAVRHLLTASIVLLLASAGPVTAQDRILGRSLDTISEECWERPWDTWRHPRRKVRHPAKLIVRNPSLDVTLRVCIFDAICRRILHSGRVEPRATLRLEACSQEGSALVYILYELGQIYLVEDLLAGFSKSVTLPIHEGYFPP